MGEFGSFSNAWASWSSGCRRRDGRYEHGCDDFCGSTIWRLLHRWNNLFNRGGCCTAAKKVYYRQPVDKLVRKVSYERVRSYRTVYVKKLYRDRCGCRKFYRNVAVQQPTVSVVRKVSFERVRAYRTVAAVKHYRKRCCCR